MNSKSKPPTKNELTINYNLDVNPPVRIMSLKVEYDVIAFEHEVISVGPGELRSRFIEACELCGDQLRYVKYTLTLKKEYGNLSLQQINKIVVGDCCTIARVYYGTQNPTGRLNDTNAKAHAFALAMQDQQPKAVE